MGLVEKIELFGCTNKYIKTIEYKWNLNKKSSKNAIYVHPITLRIFESQSIANIAILKHVKNVVPLTCSM